MRMKCERKCSTTETCWKNSKDGSRVKLSLTVDMDTSEFHKMMSIIEDVSDELLDKLSEKIIDGEDNDEDMDESEYGVHVESGEPEPDVCISKEPCSDDEAENPDDPEWSIIRAKGLIMVGNCKGDDWCECKDYKCNLTKKCRFVKMNLDSKPCFKK